METTNMKICKVLALSTMLLSVLSISENVNAQKKKKAKSAEIESKEPVKSSQDIARDLYARGKELYLAEKFEESLEAFKGAYDAQPHPVVLKSIAECQVQLKDLHGAVGSLRKYLEHSDVTDKESVEKRIEEILKTPVKVKLDSIPSGATVSLVGSDSYFTTPATEEIPPGEYTLTFKAEGYEPIAKALTVSLGENVELFANFTTEGVPIVMEPEPVIVENPIAPVADTKNELGPPAAFWVMAAVAGVGVISGTVFGTMALSMEEDYANDPTPIKKESGQRDAVIADVSFGIAAAAAVAGIVVLVTHKKKQKKSEVSKVSVFPSSSSKDFGVSASFTF